MLTVMATGSICVYDIVWDVDDPEDLEFLPHEVDVPWKGDFKLNDFDAGDQFELAEYVNDYLSDEYGFCVITYNWDI